MSEPKESPTHFKGKNPLEHVIEARKKGYIATSEAHGIELPGYYNAAADSAKETALLLLLLWTLYTPHLLSLFLLIGWLVWKVGRSAILGWARLEHLHRLIEEERWEIEHHRPQERNELKAMYEAKGFSGKLLEEVVDVLMSDDDRLLQVMLEEELGLTLGVHEHPLKQAAGAFVGVVGAGLIMSFGLFYLPAWGSAACSALVIALCAGTTAQLEKNRIVPAIIWNLAVAALAATSAYLVSQAFFS
jgi:hypothetical protein